MSQDIVESSNSKHKLEPNTLSHINHDDTEKDTTTTMLWCVV